jgi:putative tricarboxylic transport membrane protein
LQLPLKGIQHQAVAFRRCCHRAGRRTVANRDKKHLWEDISMMFKLARGIGALALCAVFAGPSAAQAPMDELTLIAPAAPGGGWDGTARAMAEVLQQAGLVKSVKVENVPGAGGTVGLAQFVKRSKDPKTVMVFGQIMVGAVLTNKSPVGLDRVTPLARLTSEWEAIVVPANSDIKTVDDLVKKLKDNVASVTWGGGSAGGTDHVCAALFAKAAGVDPSKINYIAHSGGGEAMASILGGHVTVGLNSVSEVEPQVKAGKLRWIAISSEERLPGIDAPTFKEAGINFSIGNWRGVVAAPDLAEDDKKKLADVIDKMVKSEQWKKKLQEKTWLENYMPIPQFDAYLKEETARISDVLKSVGLVK